ncbi:hypothetical protein GTZ89_17070 [Streptomyces sp. SID8382]|uniref:hypothetical protein n=1 Tax=Streptomyces malaysiensis TaxID=92644 RepID=UPI000C2C2F7A|nr:MULTISPECIES: hypothetical protein [unclassified Streptomyces]AUA16503.1 hypothetical protein CFP59_08694 [Streptomyces sp. M56]MYX57352.1 hypothetical protein [Streptomyces sp. SID8382]
MEIAVATAVGTACVARLLYVWIGSRDRARLARLREQAISERARMLPAGSTLIEQHDGVGVRVRIRVGAPAGGARG